VDNKKFTEEKVAWVHLSQKLTFTSAPISPLSNESHLSSVNMSPASSNIILSDLHFVSGWDDICGLDADEPLINNLDDDVSEVLEDWMSDDDDSKLNSIMDVDEQLGSNFFADSIFGAERSQAQELDSMDFDLESDDYFTRSSSPVSSQNFPFADDKYREAFKNLAESMQRSQETRASLKITAPKEATKHWEERRNSIRVVLSSIENSSKIIQQTYIHTIHA
jgi:hypothetical protein